MKIDALFVKIGDCVKTPKVFDEPAAWRQFAARWLEVDEAKVDLLSEKAKLILQSIFRQAKLFSCFKSIRHVNLDGNDYDLVAEGMTFERLALHITSVFDLGDIRRLLTKRFIKTVRGSSYEVDLRLAESRSLLRNISNRLVRLMHNQLLELYFVSCAGRPWTGEAVSVVLTDGLNLQGRSNYEALVQDWSLFEMCSAMSNPPRLSPAIGQAVQLIREKCQLKYIDDKGLLIELNKLESTGNFRPNMNNNQGFSGLRLLEDLAFFKLYTFSDALSKNSVYMSKDAEDRFDFIGIRLDWSKTLAEEYAEEVLRLLDLIRGSSKVDLVLLNAEGSCLRDRIICRRLAEGRQDRKKGLMKKMLSILHLANRSAYVIQRVERIVQNCALQAAFSRLQECVKESRLAEIQAKLFGYSLKYLKKSALGELKSLKDLYRRLRSMAKLINKQMYVQKLFYLTEGFLMIRKKASARALLGRNVKVADSILRNRFKVSKNALLSSALAAIKSESNQAKKTHSLLRLLERNQKGKQRESLRQLCEAASQIRNAQKKKELESQSVILLRRNYILNNFMFIFKYRESVSQQNLLGEAFSKIKAAGESKKEFQVKVKRLCDKLDKMFKKQVIRLTLGSFSEYKSRELTHNYKLGFHFLELYIKRKVLLAGFRSLASSSQRKAKSKLFEVLKKLLRKGRMRKAFGRLVAVVERRTGLQKLHNLVRYRLMHNRHSFGRVFLSKLERNYSCWLENVREALPRAAQLITKALKAAAFRQVKAKDERMLQAVRLSAIKLELIILKGKKKGLKSGFHCLSRNATKARNYLHQMQLVRRNLAATMIQSAFRGSCARSHFLKLVAAAQTIQKWWKRHFRTTVFRRRVLFEELNKKKERKRLTEIRQTALLRLKSNLAVQTQPASPFLQDSSKSSSAHTPTQTPRDLQKRQQRMQDLQDSVQHYSETLQSTSRPNKTPPTKKISPLPFGKENINPSKQQGMMRLNNETNNIEYIKHYKNKVISNHIREKEKSQKTPQVEEHAASFNTELNADPNCSSDIQIKRDSLYDLIEGVRSKIQQIRRTERTRGQL